MRKRNRPAEGGSAAFMVAVALLLILAFTSLAVDASLGLDERRDLQNAADNAALAAAFESCSPRVTGSPDPDAAAKDVALRNGFDHDGSSTIVTTQEISPVEWSVTITQVDVPSQFGQATPFASDTLTIAASATATCVYQPFLGGYAIFAAAGNCPQNELNISGSNINIEGAVHTNADVAVTGSSPVIDGAITYVPPGSANLSGTNTASPTTHQNYPLDPNLIWEYRPGGIRTTGSDYYNFTGNTNVRNSDIIGFTTPPLATGSNTSIVFQRSGIYYAPGDITLKGVTMAPGVSITLVAEGHIDIVADGDIRGYDPIDPANPNSTKMTAFSWNVNPPTCAPGPAKAVTVSASAIIWDGVIFAPNGLVDFSASNNAAQFGGSIIAYIINLSGASMTLTYDDAANADPVFTLDLLR